MTRLTHPSYLELIRTESARFREVLTDCDPTARVPSCPDWDAADLLWHLGEVQWFWATAIRTRPCAPEDNGVAAPVRPPTYDALLAFFDASSSALVDQLGAADPSEPAWSWAPEQTVGFSYRRQAHEALIHRLDAEQTVGSPRPLDPSLAVDGVAELFDVMYGGAPPWGELTLLPQHVRIDLTDTADSLWVQLGRFSGTDPDSGKVYDAVEDVALVADPGSPADVVVSGSAGDVDSWLWKRRDDSSISITGDEAIRASFLATVSGALN